MDFDPNKTAKVKQKSILSFLKKIPPPPTTNQMDSKMEPASALDEQPDFNAIEFPKSLLTIQKAFSFHGKKRSRIAGSDDDGSCDVSRNSSVSTLLDCSKLSTSDDEDSKGKLKLSGFLDEPHTSATPNSLEMQMWRRSFEIGSNSVPYKLVPLSCSEQPSKQENGTDPSAKNDRVISDNSGGSADEEREICQNSSKMMSLSLKRYPECHGTFPPLKNTSQHTVLFDQGVRDEDDKWDCDHVKLPCSPKHRMSAKSGERSFWETLHYTLTFSPITSVKDFEERMMTYRDKTLQMKGLQDYFRTCRKGYVHEFFTSTLPKIVDLALMLPSLITKPIPLLRCGMNHKITMTHQQAASLLSNAFLCTYPRHLKDFNHINFTNLLCSNVRNEGRRQKLKTFLHYFDRIAKDGVSDGNVTFERRCLKSDEFPAWSENTKTFKNMMAVDHEGKIEQEGYGMLQVDFANKYIGGGALGGGLVQEEIRFAICPELVISMLLCEKLNDNEAIIMTGAEQFSDYEGYSHTYSWKGNFHDLTEQDGWKRISTQIVAIDALPFSYGSGRQFKMATIKRELDKAYCGFHHGGDSPENLPAIATGNWGCGAFGGHPILKAVIQLMAAAALDRQLCYFTWKDRSLRKKLERLYQLMQSPLVNVGTMWRLLVEYSPKDSSEDFYSFLLDSLTELNYDD